MATASKILAYSGTLSANNPDTITLTDAGSAINVINRSATAVIWVKIVGQPDSADPTVAGDNCRPVFGVREFSVKTTSAVVKLICASAQDYTVERVV